MNFLSKKTAQALGLSLIGLFAALLSSCASLTPQQESDNSVTRHEQRAEGIQDPLKEK
jgi:hypothetical protein